MSSLNVNTINEYTSANGVTIDGVLVKDGVVAGKATEADQYQINSDITADAIPITTLVRPTGTLQAYPGTGMSQSSGTWTFPSTGYYEIFIYGRVKPNSSGHSAYLSIQASDDNFSSSDQILALRVEVESGDRVNIAGKVIVKITNTSNDKVQMGFDEVTDATLEGSSPEMVSGVIFTKLGEL
tara:strand:+ start:57 stop:605 length:549 start_codon:yes stop_codon:yes gene_type:complete